MTGFDYANEFREIVQAYSKAGGETEGLLDSHFGSLVISGDKVLGVNEIQGLRITHRQIKDGVAVKVYVARGVKIPRPVHLCFGMLPQEGRQVIKTEFFIGDKAEVRFLSHCSFPNAVHIEHIMDARVHVGKGARMSYVEGHFHSESGGTFVYPKVRGTVEKGGRLYEEFRLNNGRAGVLQIDYRIHQNEKSTTELITKVSGKADDKIEVKETLYLDEEYAAGTAKSRLVLLDSAQANVLGVVAGNAPYTRGHIDCQEIVQGENAVATSTPKIVANNPLATITHEAAIGRIDKKELETLMSRGLIEEQAIDLIVQGILK